MVGLAPMQGFTSLVCWLVLWGSFRPAWAEARVSDFTVQKHFLNLTELITTELITTDYPKLPE